MPIVCSLYCVYVNCRDALPSVHFDLTVQNESTFITVFITVVTMLCLYCSVKTYCILFLRNCKPIKSFVFSWYQETTIDGFAS